MLRVGLIGYGAIGQEIARIIAQKAPEQIILVGSLVEHTASVRPPGSPIMTTLPALLAEHPHAIIEVAGHAGLREHGAAILHTGIDLLPMSTGAFADPALLDACSQAAQAGAARIILVPGAIGALDILAAASLEKGVARVTHTMHKAPDTLLPPEEARKVTRPQVVFRGSARQAALRFPRFLNVAAAVALTGIGFDQTEVLVFADPAVKQSIHEILVEGSFGRFRFEIVYAPGRATTLVAQSVVHELLLQQKSFSIG